MPVVEDDQNLQKNVLEWIVYYIDFKVEVICISKCL